MGMTITGAAGVQRQLNKVGSVIVKSPKLLVKITSEARNRMRKRTNKGLNATGGSFTPLNSIYASYKKKKGKKAIPNLHWSGNTLNSMQVKKIRNGAEIYFNNESARKIAQAHHFGRGVPRRSFFRLGKKIENYIFKEFRKPIKKAL